MLIRPCGRGERNAAERLKRHHGLTAAEARLALAMDGSRSLRAVAEDLGIAHETARTQIKADFAKLGVSRQSELVGFLLRSAASE